MFDKDLLLIFFVIIIVLILLYYSLSRKYETLKLKYDELLMTRRSENVKHGQVWEQFVPFAKNFPFQKQDFKFIGKPVDGIVFSDNKISFVEIKTGSSSLNTKQREIKKLVNEKKIDWVELRY